jgi:fatty acid amide hydrolase 2
MDILSKSAIELASLIKNKTLSPREVVETHIRRIEEVNSSINAVVVERFEEALREAAMAEKEIASGKPVGLLHGIPFTVKECISVEGYPTTFASVFRKNSVAKKDATVIQNLKKEGAIIVGFTNTPECCLWMESYNKVYGRTNNPYDQSRTPGGSSGGEAAIVGSGGVPFGVGSDIAGSIRMPSNFCGIFGHVPTKGIIPIDGHYPFENVTDFAHNTDALSKHLKIGPMTRRAVDLLPLVKVMQNSADKHLFFEGQIKTDWRDVTVYLSPNPDIEYAASCSKEVQNQVEITGDVLRDQGAKIEYLDPKLFYHAFNIWQNVLRLANDKTMNETFGNGKSPNLFLQSLKMIVGKSELTLPALMMCIGEKLFTPGKKDIQRFLKEADSLDLKLNKILGEKGIIIMPVFPRAAPKHYTPLLRPIDWNYTTIFNALDYPSTAIPTSFNALGLPLGIQAIANRNNDMLCYRVALTLEDILGGWKMPIINTQASLKNQT